MWTRARTPYLTINAGLLFCSPEVLEHFPVGCNCDFCQEYLIESRWISMLGAKAAKISRLIDVDQLKLS